MKKRVMVLDSPGFFCSALFKHLVLVRVIKNVNPYYSSQMTEIVMNKD